MTLSRSILVAIATPAIAGAAWAQMPDRTRKDILDYAATGIGSPYVWGGAQWDPNDRLFGGADCSGFISKSWSITQWSPYRVHLHGPATYHYIQPDTRWYEVDRADLRYGDAICYRYNNNSRDTRNKHRNSGLQRHIQCYRWNHRFHRRRNTKVGRWNRYESW